MQGVVIRIVARHDPTDNFAARSRQKERGISMFEKGLLRTIEKILPLEQ